MKSRKPCHCIKVMVLSSNFFFRVENYLHTLHAIYYYSEIKIDTIFLHKISPTHRTGLSNLFGGSLSLTTGFSGTLINMYFSSQIGLRGFEISGPH